MASIGGSNLVIARVRESTGGEEEEKEKEKEKKGKRREENPSKRGQKRLSL